ncbi:MAG: HAMP domain-containing sensor histidine kinase [Anaerocolumna sp.]
MILYIILGLVILSAFFAVRYLLLSRSITETIRQMEGIQELKESNRKLKAQTFDKHMEVLLKKINDLYDSGQQERIKYQRQEILSRREIEHISRDLRTPLTSIIGYADLIQDPSTNEGERQVYLNIIFKRAKVLQGFIEDFYDLSRIEGSDYPILYESIPVENVLKEVFVSYDQQFERKNIFVEILLDEKPNSIIADKIQFNRILNNLIQNALKYANSFFILKQYNAGDECIISFQNDTNALKQEDLNYIFDRFYTGNKTHKGQSAGLGLTIAKLLTENMKGKIYAKLENNIFTIELHWKMNGL